MRTNSVTNAGERCGFGKAELSARVRRDVADYLANGGMITACEPRKRRAVYVNPCKHSPSTLNRISVARRNAAYGIPYLFPSSTFGSAGSSELAAR